MNSISKKQNGFSLTEMSVVLVIMGLLMGAVLQGKNMIAAAKIKTIIAEFTEHKLSLNSFKLKYNQHPGDFNNAVGFWGATTANGDGDGKIEFVNGSTIYEGYRMWQHLSYSQMTKSNYAGTKTTTAAALETDMPKSSAKGGYAVEYGILGMTTSNVIAIGVPLASTTTILLNGALTPKQAFEIDGKVDDGFPSYGSVRSIDGNGSTAETCVNDPSDDGVNKEDFYQISATGTDCVTGFKITGQ